MSRTPFLLLLLAMLLPVWSQPAGAQGGQAQALNRPSDPLLASFRWRSIGPANMGGRIDEIAVHEPDTRIMVKAYATGGVYRTVNNGTTWTSIFDRYSAGSFGAAAIARSNPDIIWIGTGEANNRQSSSYGAGVYKSTDGGRTFTNMGLTETRSIARVVIHPTNPDIVLVAAVGDLFSANPERGLFKTTDGGRTWRPVVYIDENTGFTELVMDPTDPNILFAASYQRRRSAAGFVGGGPGSGIWKSEDGGDTWRRLSGGGLPTGTMGRVAIDISRSNPNVVYAQIEVAPDRVPQDAEPQRPNPEFNGVWRSLDGGNTWEFRANHNIRPMYFSRIKVDPNNPEVLYTGGVQAYRSEDGGLNFQQLRGYGHVDFHDIWINPDNSDHVMLANDGGYHVTYDYGSTWESPRTLAVGQFYHVSVDMRRPYWVYGGLQDQGTWGGPSSVRTGATTNDDWFRIGGGDGFYTAVPDTDQNIIFWESQNGNVNRMDMSTGQSRSIRVRVTGQNANVVPEPTGAVPLRWNWNTPIVLSPHNPRVVYIGGNRFFRSYDLGDTWMMSEDLTKNLNRNNIEVMGVRLGTAGCNINLLGAPCVLSRNDGVSHYGTITTISESPVVPGIIWVGTDDGNVQVSRDGGNTFTDVTANVPGAANRYWVTRVAASNFDPAAAYISIDGHREGDIRPYVYVTHDYGQSWTSISSNLPEFGNVNVIAQDPRNPNLLYVGTEKGFFISLDEGANWQQFMPNLPTGRVDHVLVHPRENDLVLGTHARSIWIMDDITPLQQLTPEVLASDVHLFQPRSAVQWLNDRRYGRNLPGQKRFTGTNAPRGSAISYYIKESLSGNVQILIHDHMGRLVNTLPGPGSAGLHRIRWTLDSAQGAPAVRPGHYKITLSANGRELTRTLVVEEDIWMSDR